MKDIKKDKNFYLQPNLSTILCVKSFRETFPFATENIKTLKVIACLTKFYFLLSKTHIKRFTETNEQMTIVYAFRFTVRAQIKVFTVDAFKTKSNHTIFTNITFSALMFG